MILCHVIHYVTTVTCLFIVQEIKEKKENKIKIKYKSLSIL